MKRIQGGSPPSLNEEKTIKTIKFQRETCVKKITHNKVLPLQLFHPLRKGKMAILKGQAKCATAPDISPLRLAFWLNHEGRGLGTSLGSPNPPSGPCGYSYGKPAWRNVSFFLLDPGDRLS